MKRGATTMKRQIQMTLLATLFGLSACKGGATQEADASAAAGPYEKRAAAPAPPPATSRFAIVDAGVVEHLGDKPGLRFAVIREGDASARSFVSYGTEDSTAAGGSDYEAQQGVLEFGPGETVQWVVVRVLDDSQHEGDETLTLTVGETAAVGTILDDDSAIMTTGQQAPAVYPSQYCQTIMRSPTEDTAVCAVVDCVTGQPIVWSSCHDGGPATQ
jgi:hypothetical protein